CGVMVVSVALTFVAEEAIKALFLRIALGVGRTQTPFADRSGGVAVLLQQRRESGGPCGKRLVALGLNLAIIANESVTRMFAGHENAAGRCANCIAGIMLGQAHAFTSHSIEVGRANLLLAEAADVAVPQIIRENEDDVWAR